jgi:hypothetical protein
VYIYLLVFVCSTMHWNVFDPAKAAWVLTAVCVVSAIACYPEWSYWAAYPRAICGFQEHKRHTTVLIDTVGEETVA